MINPDNEQRDLPRRSGNSGANIKPGKLAPATMNNIKLMIAAASLAGAVGGWAALAGPDAIGATTAAPPQGFAALLSTPVTQATATATVKLTAILTATLTATPSATLTATPTIKPGSTAPTTADGTAGSSTEPAVAPTSTATSAPTSTATLEPTATPTSTPTATAVRRVPQATTRSSR